jgi:RNA polymerase sigma-70 factor, ECF subfamily
MESRPGEITRLLQRYRGGDRAAEEEVFRLLYGELRRLAETYLRRERRDHDLQPTGLINEAYLRLVSQRDREWVSRGHFVAVAAQVMRQVLVDYARRTSAEKRTETPHFALNHNDSSDNDLEKFIALDQALMRLERQSRRQVRIAELRYIAGLSVEETASILGVSARTVKREWTLARTYLRAELANR